MFVTGLGAMTGCHSSRVSTCLFWVTVSVVQHKWDYLISGVGGRCVCGEEQELQLHCLLHVHCRAIMAYIL